MQQDWTIMFYLNAKDDTAEEDVFDIFKKIAAVGSSDKINLLVEFGRGKNAKANIYGGWSSTLRFYVKKGLTPIPENAIMDFGKTDMGDAAGIQVFAKWGIKNYPANKNMLVIVDHGQGWALRARPSIPPPSQEFKSISYDPDTEHEVYNREIQDLLGEILDGKKLDVIGFDACCMAMVETAYAMRDVCDVMVASEDIEPPHGFWSSGSWLQDLAANPQMDAIELGKTIVKSYEDVLKKINMEGCLSAIDLKTSEALAEKITKFVKKCIPELGQETKNIQAARDKCLNYGAVADLHGVDCFRWFYLYSKETKNDTLSKMAKDVCNQITISVIENFATENRKEKATTDYGSYGLAIYYPESNSAYDKDNLGHRYFRSKKINSITSKGPQTKKIITYRIEPDDLHPYPVEFVKNEEWVRFLQAVGIIKVETDVEKKLKSAARTACNFWNRFVEPKKSIVIRLGTFTDLFGNIIAVAGNSYPDEEEGVEYGKVSFNTKFLLEYNEIEAASTVTHEIGHVLGFGGDTWMTMFNHADGKFKPDSIAKLKELEDMEVERDGCEGTALAHWDEDKFNEELMTGENDKYQFILPVTIEVMKFFEHKVQKHLGKKRDVNDLMTECKEFEFTQKELAESIDREYFEETEIREIIYSRVTKEP
ncbi:hypothetical protein PITCH_A720116 [uncultured Desulfobacterium sp.]|uniref:Peptidase C11 clostripain n=1 Tax=uncultured Desulfobacterium sp. TaxID=201089 RepID=A0A445N260_9BACT|nr:hypothetical protein PITCH_A720116 [uncultured Desulfobacterium sp.]